MTVIGGAPLSGEEIQAALTAFERFAAAWQDSSPVANNAVCVFTFDDDFSMGVPSAPGTPQDDAEIVRRLTALNKEITDGQRAYDPFGAVDDPTCTNCGRSLRAPVRRPHGEASWVTRHTDADSNKPRASRG